ncbi:unnamed protein product [Orchesella dallaii]|uniref:Uncharacterized protein n=1 Tax=Orchesella dallaii TaxID=48710 RepID=A0ABP1QPP7_9HEXA
MFQPKQNDNQLKKLFQSKSDEENDEIEEYDIFASQNAQRMELSQHQSQPPEQPPTSTRQPQASSSSSSTSTDIQRMNENIIFLSELDPDKNLSIWEYLKYVNKDPLVKEYMEIIKDSNFLPEEPMSDLLRDCHITPPFELSSDIQCKVINNFSCYLKGDNFVTNVKGATEHEITLFQPITKFFIPQYSLLPGKVFEIFDQCKKMCVLGMQGAAVLGESFTKELLLLRNFKLIRDTVSSQIGDEEERLEITKYFYLTLYTSTYVNYFKNKKVKNIVWSQKKSKTHGSLPKWRINKSEPPTETKCKYAEKLTFLVSQNKIKIDKVKVLSDLDTFQTDVRKSNTFFKNSKTSDNHNLSHKRKPNNRPNGPKEVRKTSKIRERQKNPRYNQNRILDSDDDEDRNIDIQVENSQTK